MTMFNKSDLVTRVAEALAVPKSSVSGVIDLALGEIILAAAKGDGYRLAGFGTFAPKTRAARVGRNPRTGEAVPVPARTALTFKPAKAGKAVL